jgi:hypothetical protein
MDPPSQGLRRDELRINANKIWRKTRYGIAAETGLRLRKLRRDEPRMDPPSQGLRRDELRINANRISRKSKYGIAATDVAKAMSVKKERKERKGKPRMHTNKRKQNNRNERRFTQIGSRKAKPRGGATCPTGLKGYAVKRRPRDWWESGIAAKTQK